MFTPKVIVIAVAFVLALALTSFLTSEHAARGGESDRQALAVALSQIRVATARVQVAISRVGVETARADSSESRANQFAAQSRKASSDAKTAWAAFEAASAANVCDSACIREAQVSHLGDSVAIARLDSALISETAAAARYKLGLDQATKSLVDLTDAAKQIAIAAKPLTKRPSRLRALLPSVGFGGAAGLDLAGKPNVVTGVTFGWHI